MSNLPHDEPEFEQRIRTWLHAEATGIRAPDGLHRRLEELSDGGRNHRRLLPWALPSGLASGLAVVILMAVAAIGLGWLRPTLGAPSTQFAASGESLQRAVEAAMGMLREAPGIEGIQRSYNQGDLATSVWFEWRPNSDVVVVQQVNTGVVETNWSLAPTSGSRTVGGNVVTTIRMLIGDRFYEALLLNGEPQGGWSVVDRAGAPRGPLALGLALLTGENDLLPQPITGDVTHGEAAGGESTWTLTASDEKGIPVQTWRIASDGTLRSWSWEVVGSDPIPGPEGDRATSATIEFFSLADAKPILAPAIGRPPSLDQFALPKDFSRVGD